MLGNRRQERQEDRQTFGRGGNAIRYQMRQRMISIGDDFWIEKIVGLQYDDMLGKIHF